VSLRRVPLAGGPSKVVLHEKGLTFFRCARAPSNLCAVDQRLQDQLIFYSYDPIRGKGPELARTKLPSASAFYNWDLSPDGSRIALVCPIMNTNRIQIVSLTGGPPQEVIVEGRNGLGSPSWSADGKGWFVGSHSANQSSLLYVDEQGHAYVLWQEPRAANGIWGIPSPDGRYLAFPATTISSNVWMIESFDQR